jgi:hypothetical protein
MILFGHTIRFEKDYADFWIQLITTGFTFYFALQLYLNDKHREKRVYQDKLFAKFKAALRPYAEIGSGVLQSHGVKLAEDYPNDIQMILDAYEEIVAENPLKCEPLYRFKMSLRAQGVRLPGDI